MIKKNSFVINALRFYLIENGVFTKEGLKKSKLSKFIDTKNVNRLYELLGYESDEFGNAESHFVARKPFIDFKPTSESLMINKFVKENESIVRVFAQNAGLLKTKLMMSDGQPANLSTVLAEFNNSTLEIFNKDIKQKINSILNVMDAEFSTKSKVRDYKVYAPNKLLKRDSKSKEDFLTMLFYCASKRFDVINPDVYRESTDSLVKCMDIFSMNEDEFKQLLDCALFTGKTVKEMIQDYGLPYVDLDKMLSLSNGVYQCNQITGKVKYIPKCADSMKCMPCDFAIDKFKTLIDYGLDSQIEYVKGIPYLEGNIIADIGGGLGEINCF